MQQAKKDAAKNWRATLSGGGIQVKHDGDKRQGENREQDVNVANDDRSKWPPAEQRPAPVVVQERAQKDRSVLNQYYTFIRNVGVYYVVYLASRIRI